MMRLKRLLEVDPLLTDLVDTSPSEPVCSLGLVNSWGRILTFDDGTRCNEEKLSHARGFLMMSQSLLSPSQKVCERQP